MNLKKITEYLKKSLNELNKIHWLTKKETLNLTSEVVIFSLFFVIIYGIIDSFLVRILLFFK